jgi:hypothetical protein
MFQMDVYYLGGPGTGWNDLFTLLIGDCRLSKRTSQSGRPAAEKTLV